MHKKETKALAMHGHEEVSSILRMCRPAHKGRTYLEGCEVAVLPLQPQIHLPISCLYGIHDLSIVLCLPDIRSK